MIGVIFLSVLSLISEKDQAKALQAAKEQTFQSTAESCVGRNAVRFAEYTTETARDVAQYAVRSCAAEITEMSKSVGVFNLNFDALARQFELKVVEWRADAAENGKGAYRSAAEAYAPVVHPSAESSQ
ncbi:hypothetical protein G6L45_16130 [Agrobacterium rhizogenes]|nr:hypothetical protein [Rhizobium rhizogenes]NTH97013.1 hypothetical protein [Rhizobium rhizogenes]NTJ15199.1 hypothetical protein [Rhizobium rhizogenes]